MRDAVKKKAWFVIGNVICDVQRHDNQNSYPWESGFHSSVVKPNWNQGNYSSQSQMTQTIQCTNKNSK